MFFFVITKNLNWEILTENVVTFKRWDGVQDEKYEYYEGSLKNPIYRRFHEKPIYRGKFPKKGRGFGQFADLKRGLAKKREVVLHPNAYYPDMRNVRALLKQMFTLYNFVVTGSVRMKSV